MPREGRELERLVAVLEDVLRHQAARVESPGHIRDTVTGQDREIDVVIRSNQSGSVLAIFECRDRAAVADVTWVEQAVTKAHDLEGAPPAVLVSTSGFTPAARRKAASYDIGVRLVTEVSIKEFQSWLRIEHVDLIVTTRGLHGCEIRTTSGETEDFSEATKAAIRRDGLNSKIFQRHTLPAISANQMFEEWYRRVHEQIEQDVPADGRPVRRKVPQRFEEPEKCFFVDSSSGSLAVAEVLLLVEITRERTLVPISRATRYADEAVELAQSVEFRLDGGLGTVSAHRSPGRPTHIRYRPSES